MQMNIQLKSFSWSLAIHALIFTAIVLLSRSMPSNKPIVIDFTIASSQDSKVEAYPNTPSQSQQSPVMNRRSTVKKREPEVKVQKTETKEVTRQVSPSPDNTPATSISDNQPPLPPGMSQDAQDTITSPEPETVSSESNGSAEGIQKDAVAAPGNAASDIVESAKAGYLKEHFTYIRDSIVEKLSYPHLARKMGWEGKVTISFIIDERGGAEDIKIIESSGFAILDKNAVEAVRKALPFPKPPCRAEIIIPVAYRLD